MTGWMFTILASITAACAAWGLSRLVIQLVDRDRRKLQHRLVRGAKGQGSQQMQRHTLLLQASPEGLSGLLVRLSLLDKLQRELHYAFPGASLSGFLGLCGGMGLMLCLLAGLASESLLISAVAGGAGAAMPVLVVRARRTRRQRLLAEQLPDALDFLARILRAGHSLNTGIQMMGQELPQPLAGEFRRCHDQLSLGQPLEDAMRDMSSRVASSDCAFFVTAVLIQRQTGGDLGEVLGHISHMIRQRMRLQQHVKAITAEGRMTGYVLVAFPALLFFLSYTLNPKYAGIMVSSDEGRMMLGLTVVLQVLGLLAIRKIVRVKV